MLRSAAGQMNNAKLFQMAVHLKPTVGRQRVSNIRQGLRKRTQEFGLLSNDAWIKANSEIEAAKLHALGVVTFRWNVCENKLFSLLWTLMNRPSEEAQILFHDLSLDDVMRRIEALAALKLKKELRLLAAIKNGVQVFHVCRQNRNQLTHFTFSFVGQLGTSSFRLALARKSRKPEYTQNVPFADTVNDVRRVARDIRRLNAFLRSVERRVAAKMRPSRKIKLRDWPLPQLLPLPKLLWDPNQQHGSKSPRPRQ
jgi:hypothetical protein